MVDARALSEASGHPVVPVFWLQTEDHDFAEVQSTTVPGAHGLVTLKVGVMQKGLPKLEGGLSSRRNDENIVELDTAKTHLEFSVLENNTIVPDADIAAAFKRQIDTILPKYLYGTPRDIRKTIPLKLPLQDYCAVYAEEDPDTCNCLRDGGDDCDLVETIDDFWESADLDDFGLLGLTIDHPLLGVNPETRGDARYLLMGTGISFKLSRSRNVILDGGLIDLWR